MLLERDRELETLGALIDQLPMTGGRVVLIRGEAGIGKSALVDAFAASRGADSYLYHGTCDDLFIPQSLGPFWDVARSEPSLRAPLVEGDRPRSLEAVLDLLSRTDRPSIFIIEDTHWADEGTLDAIRYIGRRIARTNALLLLTYRDGEVDHDHPLRLVIGDIPVPSVVRIQLGGLSPAAISAIVADSGLDPADAYAATRGNPFLATEMAAAADGGVPASLHDAVLARVQRLSSDSQEALKTLAVIPEPILRADAARLPGVDDRRLDECVRRELLDEVGGSIAFRHDLIRRAVATAMTASEHLARNRLVLETLPVDRYPSLLIHSAIEAGDIDRLIDLAPRSARYAAATGSHIQAVDMFRKIGPHIHLLPPAAVGPLLDEWAEEEFLVDGLSEAIRLSGLARDHHRSQGDVSAVSKTLTRAVHYHETAGQRDVAEALAREAVDILGPEPHPADLARALESSAYLQMMAGNLRTVPDLVERILAAGGEEIDEWILIRCLSHGGIVANIANYPAGRVKLDEGRIRAEALGHWYEEARALVNMAWAAAEFRDLPTAMDDVQRAIASATRHELSTLENYARAILARIFELRGRWAEAYDVAQDLADARGITRMVTLPVIGMIEARKGRATARDVLGQAWAMASGTAEFQRLAPVASAIAEYAWIRGLSPDSLGATTADLERVMTAGCELGFTWSPGRIAAWLWELGLLTEPPDGIAEPYRLLIKGDRHSAAVIFEARGMPYERALAGMHGSETDQLDALERLETLGATAVAAKLRQQLRDAGINVPRGRSRETRRHAAGLTARQAEVLQLLAEGLSNTEIADRLFISPRTAENHVAAVLDRLDAATREAAVSRARRDGWLPGSPSTDQGALPGLSQN